MSRRLLASLILGLSEASSAVVVNDRSKLLSDIKQQIFLAERILLGLQSSMPADVFLSYHEKIGLLKNLIKEKEKKILSSS